MDSLSLEELDQIYRTAISRKLGRLAEWEKPEIDHQIGPDGRFHFDQFETKLQSLKNKLENFLQKQDQIWLYGFQFENDPMKDLHETAIWEALEEAEIRRLYATIPPNIAAGFGHPELRADFVYWGQMSNLKLHEAVLVSVGVEPDAITTELLDTAERRVGDKSYWPPIEYLVRRREQFRRFFQPMINGYSRISIAQLNNHTERLGIEIHPEFKSQIENRIVRDSTESLEYSPPNTNSKSQGTANETPEHSEPDRKTLLKIIAALAVKGYCFDPDASRNKATAEIRSDMELLGLGIDNKTLLSKLREACELIND